MGWDKDRYVEEFGKTLGEELITPTKSNVKPQVNDETLLDTLMDMANYSIMTIIELGGTYDVCEPEPDREPTRISSALSDLPGEYTERGSVKS